MSLKDFEIIQKLGEGSYAKVYKALRLNDQKIYAIKQIHMNKLDEKSKQNALNQIRFLASFDCKNIIKYYEAFFDQQLSILCIVMQYANGGDLSHFIQQTKKQNKKIYQVQIWKALISLIHGIGYLHQRLILHRDIKPQNIFICNGLYKIGDLNVSKLWPQNYKHKQTQIGTPYYASPEIWQNYPYDHKCDVWSLGCLIYQMAALSPPFVAKSMDKLYNQVTNGKIRPIPKHYSNQLCTIINKCLQKQPSKRPTIKQLQQNFTIKMYQNLYYTSQQLEEEKFKNCSLLKTITFEKGKSFKQLQFPKPHYENKNQFNIAKPSLQIQVKQQIIPQQIQKKEQKEQKQYNNNILLVPQLLNKQQQITIIKSEQKIQTLLQNQISKNREFKKILSIKKPKQNQKLKLGDPIFKLDNNYLDKLMSDNRKVRNNFQICITQLDKDKQKYKSSLKSNINQNNKQSKIISQIKQRQNKPVLIQQNKFRLNSNNQKQPLQQTTNKNRRSLPRTQFSAKKLQTKEQNQQKSEQKKNQISSALLQINNTNVYDQKDILISKLPKDMVQVPAKTKQNKKKTIIQQIVNQQQLLIKNKMKQNRNYRVANNDTNQKQIQNTKNRQNIFGNAREIMSYIGCNSSIKQIKTSLNL